MQDDRDPGIDTARNHLRRTEGVVEARTNRSRITGRREDFLERSLQTGQGGRITRKFAGERAVLGATRETQESALPRREILDRAPRPTHARHGVGRHLRLPGKVTIPREIGCGGSLSCQFQVIGDGQKAGVAPRPVFVGPCHHAERQERHDHDGNHRARAHLNPARLGPQAHRHPVSGRPNSPVPRIALMSAAGR